MNTLTHLDHGSLNPAHRPSPAKVGHIAHDAKRSGLIGAALSAVRSAVRDASRESTIEWIERMEALKARESYR